MPMPLVVALLIFISRILAYPVLTRPPETTSLFGVAALSENIALAAGESGSIARTSDGGRHWISVQNAGGVSKDLYAVAFADRRRAWAVGSGGTMIFSTNAGITWRNTDSSSSHDLTSIAFATARVGWIAGSGGLILKTTDGGSIWIRQQSNVFTDFSAIAAIDSSTAWIAGAHGTILKTIDGGSHWTAPATDVPKLFGGTGTVSRLFGIHFPTRKLGWAVGGYGAILHSTDGGSTWTKQNMKKYSDFFETENFHYGVHFFTSTAGCLVGANGTIMQTSNGGIRWSAVEKPTIEVIRSVAGAGSGVAWAAGGDGTILKTTDQGVHWIVQAPSRRETQ